MTTPRVLENCGYDPTIIEPGIELIPVYPGSLPPQATVDPTYLPPVGAQGTPAHQGSPGSCAAWASTYGLATFTAAAVAQQAPSDPSRQASPAHIYIQVMQVDQNTTCKGSKLTSYLNLLIRGGTPNWQTAPYTADCATLWKDYDPNAEVDAIFQIPGHRYVRTNDLDAVKTVIAGGGALAYGTALNSAFADYDGTPDPLTGPLDKINGHDGTPVGHCMLIIGYDDGADKQAFLIQNSFGSGWGAQWNGSGGYVWMGYQLFQYLAQGQAFYVTGA